ncbi:AMP-binding protein [Mycobacterium angelicum]|uniref:AMP-dependent synthetase/ligase domain-containing protein n=1 Tax=Mycobacterium angelicum TaxID=470074 RepID=A0A1W9ZF42_MYCAN|nr:class I adenylate-forming enzyme family protein [Mycobacterium angelicum]ORA13473.1 hypothetical protein BST12_23915 [Mycobacterium angelicum]
MNTGTIIDAAAAGDPARTALIIDGRRINYGDLGAAVRRCAAGLAARGLVAGDRVAVVDVGSLLSIEAVLGAAGIGAAAALMNPALTAAELRVLVDNAGCVQVAVAADMYADKVREAGATDVLTGSDLGGDQAGTTVSVAEDVDARDALVLFTSGTTGLAGRLHPLVGRDLLPSFVEGPRPDADTRSPGLLPGGARQLSASRSHAMAED